MASGRSDNGGVARDVGGMGTGVVVSDVWSRERTARLLAAGGAATVTVVLFLNLRSGAEELWRIPGSTPTELNSRRWDLPDDPDRYIGLDLMFVVAFTATLLLAVSLAFVFREWRAASLSEGWWHLANIRGAGRRKMGMVATTSWWRDPLVAGAIAAGAVLCYALGDVFETLLLGDIVDQQTGGRFGPGLDTDAVDAMNRWYTLKWLSLSLAVVMIAVLWARRAPASPPASSWGDPANTPDFTDSDQNWDPSQRRLGISVSGGGIRSAAFALGALDELRRQGTLGKAAYVTSVSGGGYTTSALEHLNREGFDSDADRDGELRRLRGRLNYLLTDFPRVLGGLLRLLLGVFINLWIIYLVIFAVARPIGWMVGAPYVQENLRVSTPYVAEVVGGSDPDDTADSAAWKQNCDLDMSPDSPPVIVRDQAAESQHPGASAFVTDYPDQCVKVVGQTGSSYVAIGIESSVAGLVRFDDRRGEFVRQPEVVPSTSITLLSPTDPGFDVQEFTSLLTGGNLLQIRVPKLSVADGAEVATARTPLSEVLSNPDPLEIGVRSIVDQRSEPVLDLDRRHFWWPVGSLGVVLLVWLAGGSTRGQQIRRNQPGMDTAYRLLLPTAGYVALAATLLFLVLPWTVKEVPDVLTGFLRNGPSAEQTASVPWLPVGLPPLVAWPVLAVGTAVGFFRRQRQPTPTSSPRKRNAKALISKIVTVLIRVAVGLVLVALVLVSAVTVIATSAANGPFGNRAWISQELFGLVLPWPADLFVWTGVVLILLVSRSWFSAGTWSMGRFYRRRLRWAFASRPAASPWWRRHVDVDDRSSLTDDGDCVGRLVGTNAELVICCAGNIRGYDRAPAGRHAVSFTASRSWIGGPELGWMRTSDYVGRLSANRRDDITLAALTAISGAAVSPAMGKSSLGPIGAVMAVLNVRLGEWLPHPAAVEEMPGQSVWKHTPGWPYFLREILLRYRHECPYVYVSDGGHWENLGLVEALRRGCDRIIAISAAGDGAYSHATLAQAIEIARTDLRIDVELDDVWTMRPVAGDVPADAEPPERQYLHQSGDEPLIGQLARSGYAFGTFTRRCVSGPQRNGEILLIEAAMLDSLPVDVHAYAESHHEFPDVSTGDQFFSNADFEAYRKLGEVLTVKALSTDNAVSLLEGV